MKQAPSKGALAVRSGLPWPLPAVLVWALAWGVLWAARALGSSPLAALLVASLFGVIGSVWGGASRWRRALIALGFPVSWGLVSGVLAVPSWTWLLLAALVLVLYPPSTWKDAPLYPTPPDAFDGLRDALPLPWGGHVLDAGCGLGHGLIALNRAWPDLHMHGTERSWLLAWLCRLRCRWATVERGDMWADDWSHYDLVYLFQRPESMSRAMAKAINELKPGAWLASLEFALPEGTPVQTWECPDGRTLWLYQQPPATLAP